MPRKLLTTALLLSAMSLTTQKSSANDIIDFLRAINGVPDYDHRQINRGHIDPGPGPHPGNYRAMSRSRYAHRGPDRFYSSRYRGPVRGRSGVSFQVSLGNQPTYTQAPPPVIYQPQLPQLPAPPIPGSFGHLPHQLGQFVTCPVPLEPHVRYEDVCEIAPGAVPTIIAVRDPHLGRFRSRGCIEQLVYVQVMAPPCPVQRVRVSPCKTRIRLDYGRYEIDITSRNDCVVVRYND